MIKTLQDLLAPFDAGDFFARIHDREPLHIPGGAAKFAQVLSWRQINRLLDMTHAWSSQSLKLVLDEKPIPPEEYCAPATGRDGGQLLQPVAARVQGWIARGASVVMNDVDSLTPGLAAVSDALEGAGLGKAQANVYISWQSHKAFRTHYDTHDVWAVQVEGEKTWNIWEGRAEWPIAHPAFRGQTQDHHDRARGTLRQKVLMRPGDLLYLPRGWYHDALAEAPSSVHVAYGVHAPLGMDLLNILHERATYDVEFRKPLPRQDGSAAARFALTERAAALGRRLADLARDPKVLEVLAGFLAGYRFDRGGYDILAARGLGTARGGDAGDAPAYKVLDPGVKPVRRGADWVLKSGSGALPLTPPEAEAIAWLLPRAGVTEAELAAAHPAADARALLARLTEAGILGQA